jgi:hypothetical protein
MKRFLVSKKRNSGQILAIMAITLVGMLGFLAIAIDGGMIYADRRYDQNAADSASLTGAAEAITAFEGQNLRYDEFTCSNSKVVTAMQNAATGAIQAGTTHNFSLENNLDNQHGVEVKCVNNGSDRFLEITVMVTTEVNTSFAQVFTNDAIKNTVKAVTHVRPSAPFGLGNAIISLDTTCGKQSGGIFTTGNPKVHVNNGGIFSNSCLNATGNVKISANGVSYTTTYNGPNGSGSYVNPTPVQVASTLPKPHIASPDCSGLTNYGSITVHGNENLSPGIYNSITINAHGIANLAPGLYCIQNDIKSTGQGSLQGSNVTLYLQNGSFDLMGGAEVNLTAPVGTMAAVAPAIPGIVIFVDESNTNTVKIVGNSSSQYTGTVYAPSSTIQIGGTSSALETVHTQLIGDNIFVHGTTDVTIQYSGDEQYHFPALLDLYE